ncbi:MAG TPA: CBS domain-containing protein [Candidatus Nitrosotenuis sp.]
MSHSEYANVNSKIVKTIHDIKNTGIIGVQINSTLHNIILNLVSNKISKIFVFDNDRPVGIITDKDIIRFLYIDKSGRSLDSVYAAEIMNSVCFVFDNMTCQQAAQMMIINKISTLAIGSKENLEGIVTKTDLLKYYVNNQQDKSKVSDYMTVSYFSARTDDRLYEIIKKMILYDISRIVVTDSANNPVGIITNGDIFKITMTTSNLDIVQSSLSRYTEQDGLWSETGFVGSQLAAETMTEGIITIDSDTNVKTAAKILVDKRIDCLGINNSQGQLVGLINKTNILYALANSNRECPQ